MAFTPAKQVLLSLLGGTYLSLYFKVVGCLATSALCWIKEKLQDFKLSGLFPCGGGKNGSDALSSFLHLKLSDFKKNYFSVKIMCLFNNKLMIQSKGKYR